MPNVSKEQILEPRIIKTDEQYRRFRSEVEKLAADDPAPDSPQGCKLELLAKLVEDYEKARFVFEKPDPVDAILFRMEQQGLRQKDLAELLGGKNRASEVLSRKRPLTLPMIRSLYERLDIPAALLIREPESRYEVPGQDSDFSTIPSKEILKRRWVQSAGELKSWVQRALAPVGSPAFLEHTMISGATATTNDTRVWLWLARVREVAESRTYLNGRYQRDAINEAALSYLVKLSWMERGPQLAREFLEEKGVALVIEPHLKGSRVDGAAMLSRSGVPIIGLTIRHDRLDNFWFTLIHECVHAWKHLDAARLRAIVDEDVEKPDAHPVAIEKEANDMAAELLLPRAAWRRSEAHRDPSSDAIKKLAHELHINPAIVVGRLRSERKAYGKFTKMIGKGQVRKVFPEVKWGLA